MVVDRNLYFDTRATNATLPGDLKISQARGFDLHSIAADPLFVDAKHDDFRLSPQSPALRLGFRPFALPAVGPRPDRLVHCPSGAR